MLAATLPRSDNADYDKAPMIIMIIMIKSGHDVRVSMSSTVFVSEGSRLRIRCTTFLRLFLCLAILMQHSNCHSSPVSNDEFSDLALTITLLY